MLFKKTFYLILIGYFSLVTNSYASYYEDEYPYYEDDSNYYSPYSSNDDNYYDDDTPRKPPSKHKKHRSKSTDDDDAPSYANSYYSRLPGHISSGEKVILVDPRVHAWGAYDESGELIRAGLATAGSKWCKDLGRPCRTSSGTFRINSMGDSDCYSTKFPLGKGGAPMPYCMYFNGSQGLHGSYEVVEGNVSHGCVRLKVEDAEWLRYNFSEIGTKVVVLPY